MKKLSITALVCAGFVGGMVFVYSCGGSGGGGGGVVGNNARAAAISVGTAISSLPYTISAPGLYYLKQNLTIAGSDGITVEADDVTIDLMGFTLSGDDTVGSGILMIGCSNVEVRNGTVRDFGYGIYENSVTTFGHRIINVRVISNTSTGILLSGNGHQVKDSTALYNAGQGISAGAGANVTGNNAAFNGTTGLTAGVGSTVVRNTAYGNTDNGFTVGSATIVSENAITYNGGVGILLGSGSAVRGNVITFNTGVGIASLGGVFIDSNTVDGNDAGGASVNINCSLSPCTITANNLAP